jgi:phage tail sheath protein FI
MTADYPGMYVEEVPHGVPVITGVETSITVSSGGRAGGRLTGRSS